MNIFKPINIIKCNFENVYNVIIRGRTISIRHEIFNTKNHPNRGSLLLTALKRKYD